MSSWFSFGRPEVPSWAEEDVEEAEFVEDYEEPEEEPEEETAEPYRIEDDLVVITSSRETDNQFFQISKLDSKFPNAGETGGVFTATDGVVQIDEHVYEEPPEPSRDDVQELVDSVVREADEEETLGIDDILAPGGGLDLLPVGREAQEPESELSKGPRKPTLGARGLDYDAILGAYPNNDGGVLKSLIEFTRSWGARAAGVLLPAGEEMRLDYSLAIEEKCRRNFRIPNGSDVFRHVFSQRSMLLTREPLHRFRAFHGLCSESALAYIGTALLLPIIFRQQEAYLILAVKESANNIEELLESVGFPLPQATAAETSSRNT
jgi:hypothetical protein